VYTNSKLLIAFQHTSPRQQNANLKLLGTAVYVGVEVSQFEFLRVGGALSTGEAERRRQLQARRNITAGARSILRSPLVFYLAESRWRFSMKLALPAAYGANELASMGSLHCLPF
jgi:hypothetical protein